MITFHHPPTGTNNPLRDFQPNNQNHYPGNVPGIYIYGIRTKVEGDLKFVPLVVGETKNLRNRLFNDHYCGKFRIPFLKSLGLPAPRNAGDRKEVWNFPTAESSLAHIKSVYSDINHYNLFNNAGTKAQNSATLNHLLFFQNTNFFDFKYIGRPRTNQGTDIPIEDAVEYLSKLAINPFANCPAISFDTSKLIATLANFSENFYFVHADSITSTSGGQLDLSKHTDRQVIENTIKEALGNNLKIQTSAKAGNRIVPLQIDLSNIQSDLVNVGDHKYVDPNGPGGYMNSLIL